MSRRGERVTTIVEPKQEEFERKRGVTGISVEEGLVHVEVQVPPNLKERLNVFKALAEAGVSLFLIKFHPDSIHFLIRREVLSKAQKVLQSLDRPTKV
ncbi:MAG: hypothetical protein ACK40X_09145, partial [Armatimonadota bacterium]